MILFVCTGNTCRSAMAEALLRTRLRTRLRARLASADAGRPVPSVASAGIAVDPVGGPATPTAVEVLADRGIDLAGHRSRSLAAGDLAAAELVVAATRRHEAAIGALDPLARSRTFLAGEVVRLGGTVGPRGDRTVAAWVAALDAARAGHFTAGRVADEVADPWGGTADDYRRCADRLDGICTALARLLVDPGT